MDLFTELSNQFIIFKNDLIDYTIKWAKFKLQNNIIRRDNFISLYLSSNNKVEDLLGKKYQQEYDFTYKSPHWFFTDALISNEIKISEKYHNDSIKTLFNKILDTNLNINNITFGTTTVKHNSHFIITDGIKTLTIIMLVVHGDKIRPHYRYTIH